MTDTIKAAIEASREREASRHYGYDKAQDAFYGVVKDEARFREALAVAVEWMHASWVATGRPDTRDAITRIAAILEGKK